MNVVDLYGFLFFLRRFYIPRHVTTLASIKVQEPEKSLILNFCMKYSSIRKGRKNNFYLIYLNLGKKLATIS